MKTKVKVETPEVPEIPVEESVARKAFRATWEAYKLQDPEKYAIKVANGEFESQLAQVK